MSTGKLAESRGSSSRYSASTRDLDDSGVHLDDGPATHQCCCDESQICLRCGGSRSRDVTSSHAISSSPDNIFMTSECCVTSPAAITVTSSDSLLPIPECRQRLLSDDITTGVVTSSVGEYSMCVENECVLCDVCDVIRSAPDCSIAVPVAKHKLAGRVSAGHNRNRFKRLFEPLRRSHSTGNQAELAPCCSHIDTSTTTTTMAPTSNKQETCSTLQCERQHTSSQHTSSQHWSTVCDSQHASSQHWSTVDVDQHKMHSDTGTKKKTLTSEVRDRLHVLRRRCLELTSPGRENINRPSLDAVKLWNNSLETLLADKFGRQCFREFLKSEFSEENVEFWIACEDFKNLKTPNLATAAQKIYSEFIAHQAPREINIDSITRDITYSNMAAGPHLSMFEPAQKRIQALMDRDSYPRFLQSDLYLYLLKQAAGSSA